jgi:hypothetical protein
MARQGNREMKKPKQVKDKPNAAATIADLAAQRGKAPAGKK